MKRTDEYVICSAIWYKDIPLQMDDFPEGFARPLNCDKGLVFCGQRHHNCMYQMCAISGFRSVKTDVGDYEQGFLTSKNMFVDRKQALKIALAAGQVDENNLGNPLIGLFSEDLY